MYSALVLDHFEHPRNAGQLADAAAVVTVENPACGDILEISVRLEADSVAGIAFRAKGCVPSVACASCLTEMVRGKSVAEALKIRREDILEALGGLPSASGHAAQLAVDALRAALSRKKRKKFDFRP